MSRFNCSRCYSKMMKCDLSFGVLSCEYRRQHDLGEHNGCNTRAAREQVFEMQRMSQRSSRNPLSDSSLHARLLATPLSISSARNLRYCIPRGLIIAAIGFAVRNFPYHKLFFFYNSFSSTFYLYFITPI